MLNDAGEVALEAPAGEDLPQPFPLKDIPGFAPSARFLGLLNKSLASARPRMGYTPRAAGNCKLVEIANGLSFW